MLTPLHFGALGTDLQPAEKLELFVKAMKIATQVSHRMKASSWI